MHLASRLPLQLIPATFEVRDSLPLTPTGKTDRQVLIAALIDGTLDCVATDHAPHRSNEKEAPFEEAPFGVTGLETAFAACHTHLKARPRDFKLARHTAIGIYDFEVDLWLNGAIPDKVANDSGESLINNQAGRTDFRLDVTLGPRRC